MQIEVLVRQGPVEGLRRQARLGRLTVGREPGPEGLLLPDDAHVSRQHGELFEEEGRVVYRNLSPNGTVVDRRPVRDRVVLEPRSELRFGDLHVVEVQYRPRLLPAATGGGDRGILKRGLLQRPLVRGLLAAYLLGIVALALGMALRGESDPVRRFEPVGQSYAEEYRPEGVGEAALEDRLARARHLVQELARFERAGRRQEAKQACRSLMALDADPASPVYRFAARRLGELESGP